MKNATINGKNSDLWLRDFSASRISCLRKQTLEKRAHRYALDTLIDEVVCFRNEVVPESELPHIKNPERQKKAKKLQREQIELRFYIVNSVCNAAEEILKAFKKYDAEKINDAWRIWSQTITSTNLDYFLAKRVPHYLTLRNNVPSL